jgi:hypothetical protein
MERAPGAMNAGGSETMGCEEVEAWVIEAPHSALSNEAGACADEVCVP